MARLANNRLTRALAALGVCVSAPERPPFTLKEEDYPEIDFG